MVTTTHPSIGEGPDMKDLRRLSSLVLAIIVVGVLHMGEQLLFGIEEYFVVRGAVGRWHALFPAAWADHASVLLITIVVTGISLVLYALLRGGRSPLVVAGAFGVLGIGEAHHWIAAITQGGYDPGLITSLAYPVLGVAILVEVRRQWRRPVGRVEPTRQESPRGTTDLRTARRAHGQEAWPCNATNL